MPTDDWVLFWPFSVRLDLSVPYRGLRETRFQILCWFWALACRWFLYCFCLLINVKPFQGVRHFTLLFMWTTSIMPSIGPIAFPLSLRCWANFYLLFLYLKSLECFWNLILKGIPICPVYFILESGQISWYIPLLSYLFRTVPCFVARRLPIVFSVVNETLKFVFLNIFVRNRFSLPT